MSRKSKLIVVALLVSVICAVAAFRIAESPSRVLQHALRLKQLPSSVSGLRMHSDVWTDEVRRFYFEIEPSEFPALLAGRPFRAIDMGGAFEVHASHVSPPVAFTGRWIYRWEGEGAYCEIKTNEERNRICTTFAAD